MKPLLNLLLAALLSGCVQTSATKSVEEFAVAYKKAKTESEKRSVCINAIDAGRIRRWGSVESVKKIFGGDYEDRGVDSRGENKLGMVHFIPPVRSTNPLVSDFVRGWYLSVTYRPDGSIVAYNLSNMSKESDSRIPADEKKLQDPDVGLPPVIPVPEK